MTTPLIQKFIVVNEGSQLLVLHHGAYRDILRQTRNRNQGHGRHIHVWCWESSLYKALGPDWHEYARHREFWYDILMDLVSWCQYEAWTLPYARAFFFVAPPPSADSSGMSQALVS